MVSVTAHLHAWRRVAFGIVGVAAVLVCLLAMSHGTLTGARGSVDVAPAPQALPVVQQLSPATDAGGTAPSGERCGALCLPAHQMAATTCTLVLLAALALLAIDLIVTRRNSIRGFLVALIAQAAALAPPAPPSLHVLSISRT